MDPQDNGKKPVSRQRRWQLKQIAAGRCMLCGKKRSNWSSHLCDEHLATARERARRQKGCNRRFLGARSYKIAPAPAA